jgi:hypothetical protein
MRSEDAPAELKEWHPQPSRGPAAWCGQAAYATYSGIRWANIPIGAKTIGVSITSLSSF